MIEQINRGENLPPELENLVKRTAYRPTDPLLLPPARFSDTPAAGWQCAIIGAPTSTGETRERSRAVTMRLMLSSAGWKQRPTAAEFYEAVRAKRPTARQQALLSTWAAEAEWYELLEAWTEHAYTLRELVEALHRAGLSRCRAAEALGGDHHDELERATLAPSCNDRRRRRPRAGAHNRPVAHRSQRHCTPGCRAAGRRRSLQAAKGPASAESRGPSRPSRPAARPPRPLPRDGSVFHRAAAIDQTRRP